MFRWMLWVLLLALNCSSFAFDFKDEHRLVFFFSSLCPHCQSEAPIVKAYAKAQMLQVEAYTLDGQGLPEFPKPKIPSEDLIKAAFAGQSIQTPATFIMNTKTLILYPLAIGELNFEELSSRMAELQVKVIDFERGFA